MFYLTRRTRTEVYCGSVGQLISIGISRRACLIAVLALLAAALFSTSAYAAAAFSLHYIEPAANTTWATSAMQGTLSDLDNDGDLDWTVGNDSSPALYWYEYRSADNWVRHTISSGVSGVGEGAASLDVDGDGDRDLISGRYLFRNNNNGASWSRYNIGTAIMSGSNSQNHDHVAVDINKDGKLDLLTTNSCGYAGNSDGEICWYQAPANPTQSWTKHAISTGSGVPAGYEGLHAATSPYGAGDLNGDGRIDVVGACGWYENANAAGTSWIRHQPTDTSGRYVFLGVDGPYETTYSYQTAVRSYVCDLNGDGSLDVVQAEADNTGEVRIGWLKNNGSGNFTQNIIRGRTNINDNTQPSNKEDYHSLAVADFDKDGDIDIFTAAGPLAPAGATSHGLFLFENTAGPGHDPVYVLHNLAESLSASDATKLNAAFSVDHCHEPMFGDVNGDGKIDLILKGWDGRTPGSTTRSQAPFIYLENTTVVTPEPSTLTLLGIGALGLLTHLWRRRQQAA